MSDTASETSFTVALLGNPNTGKSTLFNGLAGVRQRVGNYPGVTVEKKVGHLAHEGRHYALVDLPGTYSLAPRSPDEMVAVDVLLGRRGDTPPPDVVLSIVDASNLERNLYLLSQVLELGLPTVVALNMTDVAQQRGIAIDVARLSAQLGVPVVEVQAHRRRGLAELKTALAYAVGGAARAPTSPFPEAFQREVDRLAAHWAERATGGAAALPRYLVERLLLDTAGYLTAQLLDAGHEDPVELLDAARGRLAVAGCAVPAVEALARYEWVAKVLEGVITRPASRAVTISDRIDWALTHRLWGTLFFLLMMVLVFQSVFRVAALPMEWIEAAQGAVGDWTSAHMSEGALRSLLVKGLIDGVGGVIIFLPQIMILFLFIAVLEDCGYMARAAYLMDRLMVKVGLSGKSFIPLLSSFACAIPGVMATRVIENRRDRLTTILVAPLMSCSARLPVYTLLIAAFIPDRSYAGGLLGLQGLTMTTMYLVGIVTAMFVALLLKKSLLRGPTPPFVMELPSYKWPSPATVVYRMVERGWSFIRRAGTLVVAVSVLVWAALYYPHDAQVVEGPFRERLNDIEAELAQGGDGDPRRDGLRRDVLRRDVLRREQARLRNEILGAYNRQSYLGRLGRAIEPAVRPLGWDWRIGCAVIASFPAREVVVATLGIIYNLGEDVTLEDEQARGQLVAALTHATWEDDVNRPVFNVPVALSIMVFFALCAQCASTLVVIKRETNSWGWPAFTFVYMTALAYVAALITYQVGMWCAT
ncbi:MAG TPA: ferrous iron transport protein B [Pirellulales bacterium]|nr:ferrous iron transport protein B [Pirellulales bacterium]